MTAYTAAISWVRGDQPFTDGKYSRRHRISFDGGVAIDGSSSPHVVRPPLSAEDAADPEELLIAAVSSCHMLFFLDFARKAGFVVDTYEDAAEGDLAKDDRGVAAMTEIRLRPAVAWFGEKRPSADDIAALHHKAHEACFIANSLRGAVKVLPR